VGDVGVQDRHWTNALKPSKLFINTHLHVLDHKVNVNAALGGGSVVPLGEEGSGRSPAQSPVLASYSTLAYSSHNDIKTQKLTKPGDRSAARRVPDKKAILNSHARGTVLTAVDLSDGAGVLLGRLGDLEALRVFVAEAEGRVGDGASDGV